MTKLFDDTATETPVEETIDDPLAYLVGEDKKFKSPQDLAKSKLEADRFINQLQDELKGLREELTTRVKVEDAVDKLLSARTQSTPLGQETPSTPSQGETNDSREKNSLSLDDVKKLLEQEKVQARAEANVERTKDLLKQTYGGEWKSNLEGKLKELGESPAFFQSLAERNPTAVVALLGAPEAKPKDPSLFTSSVNTTASQLKPQGSGERNKSYYDKLKASDPKTYWLPKTQNQMHQDALRLRESFFN